MEQYNLKKQIFERKSCEYILFYLSCPHDLDRLNLEWHESELIYSLKYCGRSLRKWTITQILIKYLKQMRSLSSLNLLLWLSCNLMTRPLNSHFPCSRFCRSKFYLIMLSSLCDIRDFLSFYFHNSNHNLQHDFELWLNY